MVSTPPHATMSSTSRSLAAVDKISLGIPQLAQVMRIVRQPRHVRPHVRARCSPRPPRIPPPVSPPAPGRGSCRVRGSRGPDGCVLGARIGCAPSALSRVRASIFWRSAANITGGFAVGAGASYGAATPSPDSRAYSSGDDGSDGRAHLPRAGHG